MHTDGNVSDGSGSSSPGWPGSPPASPPAHSPFGALAAASPRDALTSGDEAQLVKRVTQLQMQLESRSQSSDSVSSGGILFDLPSKPAQTNPWPAAAAVAASSEATAAHPGPPSWRSAVGWEAGNLAGTAATLGADPHHQHDFQSRTGSSGTSGAGAAAGVAHTAPAPAATPAAVVVGGAVAPVDTDIDLGGWDVEDDSWTASLAVPATAAPPTVASISTGVPLLPFQHAPPPAAAVPAPPAAAFPAPPAAAVPAVGSQLPASGDSTTLDLRHGAEAAAAASALGLGGDSAADADGWDDEPPPEQSPFPTPSNIVPRASSRPSPAASLNYQPKPSRLRASSTDGQPPLALSSVGDGDAGAELAVQADTQPSLVFLSSAAVFGSDPAATPRCNVPPWHTPSPGPAASGGDDDAAFFAELVGTSTEATAPLSNQPGASWSPPSSNLPPLPPPIAPNPQSLGHGVALAAEPAAVLGAAPAAADAASSGDSRAVSALQGGTGSRPLAGLFTSFTQADSMTAAAGCEEEPDSLSQQRSHSFFEAAGQLFGAPSESNMSSMCGGMPGRAMSFALAGNDLFGAQSEASSIMSGSSALAGGRLTSIHYASRPLFGAGSGDMSAAVAAWQHDTVTAPPSTNSGRELAAQRSRAGPDTAAVPAAPHAGGGFVTAAVPLFGDSVSHDDDSFFETVAAGSNVVAETVQPQQYAPAMGMAVGTPAAANQQAALPASATGGDTWTGVQGGVLGPPATLGRAPFTTQPAPPASWGPPTPVSAPVAPALPAPLPVVTQSLPISPLPPPAMAPPSSSWADDGTSFFDSIDSAQEIAPAPSYLSAAQSPAAGSVGVTGSPSAAAAVPSMPWEAAHLASPAAHNVAVGHGTPGSEHTATEAATSPHHHTLQQQPVSVAASHDDFGHVVAADTTATSVVDSQQAAATGLHASTGSERGGWGDEAPAEPAALTSASLQHAIAPELPAAAAAAAAAAASSVHHDLVTNSAFSAAHPAAVLFGGVDSASHDAHGIQFMYGDDTAFFDDVSHGVAGGVDWQATALADPVAPAAYALPGDSAQPGGWAAYAQPAASAASASDTTSQTFAVAEDSAHVPAQAAAPLQAAYSVVEPAIAPLSEPSASPPAAAAGDAALLASVFGGSGPSGDGAEWFDAAAGAGAAGAGAGGFGSVTSTSLASGSHQMVGVAGSPAEVMSSHSAAATGPPDNAALPVDPAAVPEAGQPAVPSATGHFSQEAQPGAGVEAPHHDNLQGQTMEAQWYWDGQQYVQYYPQQQEQQQPDGSQYAYQQTAPHHGANGSGGYVQQGAEGCSTYGQYSTEQYSTEYLQQYYAYYGCYPDQHQNAAHVHEPGQAEQQQQQQPAYDSSHAASWPTHVGAIASEYAGAQQYMAAAAEQYVAAAAGHTSQVQPDAVAFATYTPAEGNNFSPYTAGSHLNTAVAPSEVSAAPLGVLPPAPMLPGAPTPLVPATTAAAASSNLYSTRYAEAQALAVRAQTVAVEASGLPVTQALAIKCPNGRPPCTSLCFGFGGRAVLCRPLEAPGVAGGSLLPTPGVSGPLIICSTAVLPQVLAGGPDVSAAVSAGLAEAAAQASAARGGKAAPWDRGGAVAEGGQAGGVRRAMSTWPGPLAPNTPKDKLSKYIEERMRCCDEEEPVVGSGSVDEQRLMWSVLHIMVKHGGQLRSAPKAQGRDDAPEAELLRALMKLPPPSAVKKGARASSDGALSAESVASTSAVASSPVLLPAVLSEAQQQAAACEVQRLLTEGKKGDALKAAVGAQLWGPALLLASATAAADPHGFQDTVVAMAQASLVPGAPLRTLTLLLAGRPDMVHASPDTPGGADVAMLSQWREHLAVIAGHRTPADQEVILRLGDRLKAEAGQLHAAHVCYLLAGCPPSFTDASDQPPAKLLGAAAEGARRGATPRPDLSDATAEGAGLPTVRYCLLGSDAQLCPRTFVSVLSLHRTEVLEHCLRMAAGGADGGGLLALQPYKLVHAHMLAEHGRVPEALLYIQALDAAMRSSRVPTSFVWLHRGLEDMRDRLTHFMQSNNIAAAARPTSSFTMIGRLLDRTLTSILWTPEERDKVRPAGAAAPPPSTAPGAPGNAAHSSMLTAMANGTLMGGPLGGAAAPMFGAPAVAGSAVEGAGPLTRTGSITSLYSGSVSDMGHAAPHRVSGYGDNQLGGAATPPGGWQYGGGGMPSGATASPLESHNATQPNENGRSSSHTGSSAVGYAAAYFTSAGAAAGAAAGGGSGKDIPPQGADGAAGAAVTVSSPLVFVPSPPTSVSGDPSMSSLSAGFVTGRAAGHSRAQSDADARWPGGAAASAVPAFMAAPPSGPKAASPDVAGRSLWGAAPPSPRDAAPAAAATAARRMSGNSDGAAGSAPAPASASSVSNKKGWGFGISNLISAALPMMPSKGAKSSGNLGDENEFYFCKKRNKWVMRGAEEQVDAADAAPPPPPTSFGGSSVQDRSSMSPPPGPAPSAGPPPTVPPGAPGSSGGSFLSRGTGLRAKYVDTFNTAAGGPVSNSHAGGSSAGGAAMAPSGTVHPGPPLGSYASFAGGSGLASSLVSAKSAEVAVGGHRFFMPSAVALTAIAGGGAGAAEAPAADQAASAAEASSDLGAPTAAGYGFMGSSAAGPGAAPSAGAAAGVPAAPAAGLWGRPTGSPRPPAGSPGAAAWPPQSACVQEGSHAYGFVQGSAAPTQSVEQSEVFGHSSGQTAAPAWTPVQGALAGTDTPADIQSAAPGHLAGGGPYADHHSSMQYAGYNHQYDASSGSYGAAQYGQSAQPYDVHATSSLPAGASPAPQYSSDGYYQAAAASHSSRVQREAAQQWGTMAVPQAWAGSAAPQQQYGASAAYPYGHSTAPVPVGGPTAVAAADDGRPPALGTQPLFMSSADVEEMNDIEL